MSDPEWPGGSYWFQKFRKTQAAPAVLHVFLNHSPISVPELQERVEAFLDNDAYSEQTIEQAPNENTIRDLIGTLQAEDLIYQVEVDDNNAKIYAPRWGCEMFRDRIFQTAHDVNDFMELPSFLRHIEAEKLGLDREAQRKLINTEAEIEGQNGPSRCVLKLGELYTDTEHMNKFVVRPADVIAEPLDEQVVQADETTGREIFTTSAIKEYRIKESWTKHLTQIFETALQENHLDVRIYNEQLGCSFSILDGKIVLTDIDASVVVVYKSDWLLNNWAQPFFDEIWKNEAQPLENWLRESTGFRISQKDGGYEVNAV